MKKIFIIVCISLGSFCATAQDDPGGGKIQQRMREYIQNRLGLSKGEADKFTPVFMRYLREFQQTHHKYQKGDRLVLQKEIIELRLRYRGEFKQIMDETKANQVYKHEDDFRREVVQIIKENRMKERPGKRQQRLLD